MAASRNEIAQISGPESMAKPTGSSGSQTPHNANEETKPKKRGGKKNKKGKKKRQSFHATEDNGEGPLPGGARPSVLDATRPSGHTPGHAVPGNSQTPFYQLQPGGGNRSNTSLESEALLDHRDHAPLRARRGSLGQQTGGGPRHGFARPSLPFARTRGSSVSNTGPSQRPRPTQVPDAAISEGDDEDNSNDRTPLLSGSRNGNRPGTSRNHSGQNYGSSNRLHARRSSKNSGSSRTGRGRAVDIAVHSPIGVEGEDYDVNNPPSHPGTPTLGSLEDPMMHELSNNHADRGNEAIIDIDDDMRRRSESSPDEMRRRGTVADLAERDVCFPAVDVSDEGEDDRQSNVGSTRLGRKRTRARQWPDLEILDEWSREEKEERSHQDHIRAKKINEPVMVGGRLRPGKAVWHREEDDAPFRFTYFNEMFDGTIHARTISDLCQEGATFKDLFQPDAVELSDDSDDEEDEDPNALQRTARQPSSTLNARMTGTTQVKQNGQPEGGEKLAPAESNTGSNATSGRNSQTGTATPRPSDKQKRYGPRPTFWLDVLEPTEVEMKVLAKAFGIHQLTTEDILMDEEREKVELFQSYYFINYRSFEQDKDDSEYMEPVNFFAVVFRDGVITFHHSQTPHPANVRRRIRQLNDYMSPTADWISYALIDDITDVYAPLVSQIEREVDDIDDEILCMHQTSADDAVGTPAPKPSSQHQQDQSGKKPSNQADMGALKSEGEKTAGESGGDMLRRVGNGRKKVMSLYRLLGNKADVIKGFAKRCNEHWEVAPRSEIGLYLGDIQDHIITMNANLGHYESLLSRAHSNYVAQINIRMNERAEQNADVLGKLTVLGTIVLPMNIITGMWGMNVWVPGQEYEGDLTWFWCITAGLLAFGLACFFIAKRVYGIV